MPHRASGPAAHPSSPALDERSATLLQRLQRHIPLVERPFLALGDELNMAEDEVLARFDSLRRQKLLRQTSAIFDAAKLGYSSCLVAARYPDARIDEAAAVISACPGVSHNYRRDHAFNLWYTLAVPPGCSLEEAVERLHGASGAESTRTLPTVRRFKLAVNLPVAGAAETEPDEAPAEDGCARPLSEQERAAVRALQDDLPALPRPFEERAAAAGFTSAAELLEVAEALRSRGVLRRFSGIVRHRAAGFSANGMAVWPVPDERCAEAGGIMASFASVSHCYQRPTYPDWPYSLFTMIHGRGREEVEDCVRAIAAATGLEGHRVLYSSTEYKKQRVRYFTDEWEAWQRVEEGRR